MSDDKTREERIKRLRYRAWHRGTKELDLLIGPFADSHLAGLNVADLGLFERLLEAPEPRLYAWILGQEAPSPEHDHPVFQRLKAFHAKGRGHV